MRGFVLAQLRRGGGRLVAAGIAIALGSAFVAAAFLGSDIVKQTAYNSVSASYADADVVLRSTSFDGALTDEQLATVTATPGVAAVAPTPLFSFLVEVDEHADWLRGGVVASVPELEASELAEGRLPKDATELALGSSNAQRLGVVVGDKVVVTNEAMFFAEDGAEHPADRMTVTVVGLLTEPPGFSYESPTAVMTPELAVPLAVPPEDQAQAPTSAPARTALVLLEPGAKPATVLTALRDDPAFTEVDVVTVEEAAHASIRSFSGETDILTGFVLAFAGIALVVAAIVISNTFQVLVAQRAQLLALLRCVGATRRQVRGSVLLEAAVVGLVASTVGLGLGVLLAQAALWIVPTLDLAVPVPTTVSMSSAVVLWPLLTGTLVTILAALAPARVATRVAPLAALRPLELVPVRKAGRTRLALALLGTVGGGLALAAVTFGAVATDLQDPMIFVGLGILAGAVSFAGVLVGAVYFVPGVARLLGRVASRFGGVPGKVAAANSVRNPRRTTATASALLIGATLVTMLATGAATARGSLATLLDESFPVDVAVRGSWTATGAQVLSPAQIAAAEQADGVAAAVPVYAKIVDVETPNGSYGEMTVNAAPDAELPGVVRTSATLPGPGVAAAPSWFDIEDGQAMTLRSGDVTIDVTVDSNALGSLWLSQSDFDALGGEATTAAVWLRLERGVDARDFTASLQDTFTELSATVGDPPVEVSGAAVERASYEQVIDTILAILVGLLGVAVVIALVGVANTLSLSVIERRRESATLRAIGLRRGQLRQMLAVEGVIIALVGAVLGAVLGLAYGWAGSTLLLGASGGLTLAVPWRDLALILVVAVAAGLLASVLPSRTATRTPPVAALAVD